VTSTLPSSYLVACGARCLRAVQVIPFDNQGEASKNGAQPRPRGDAGAWAAPAAQLHRRRAYGAARYAQRRRRWRTDRRRGGRARALLSFDKNRGQAAALIDGNCRGARPGADHHGWRWPERSGEHRRAAATTGRWRCRHDRHGARESARTAGCGGACHASPSWRAAAFSARWCDRLRLRAEGLPSGSVLGLDSDPRCFTPSSRRWPWRRVIAWPRCQRIIQPARRVSPSMGWASCSGVRWWTWSASVVRAPPFSRLRARDHRVADLAHDASFETTRLGCCSRPWLF